MVHLNGMDGRRTLHPEIIKIRLKIRITSDTMALILKTGAIARQIK